MDTPAAETAPKLLLPPPPQAAARIGSGELAQALGPIAAGERPAETAIRETVEAAGGALLFQMRLDGDEAARWVAAAAFGEDGAREIAIIDLPCGGGSVSVTPAADSTLPIAAIAPAYAGLAECWRKAA